MVTKSEDNQQPFSASEEFQEMLSKGKSFTQELMAENERLRFRAVQLEKESMELAATLTREVERLKLERSQLAEKHEFLERRFSEVEAESRDFAQRFVEIEEQNATLANLYVTTYQLHSTLDQNEVVQYIKEILVNLVGTEEFGLYVYDDDTDDLVLIGSEGELIQLPGRERILLGKGIEGECARTGEPYFVKGDPKSGETFALIPLKLKERVVGMITIYRLLPHKKGLNSLDHEILQLLAGQAATALVSSKLYASADRKLKTMEGFMTMLRKDGMSRTTGGLK